MAKQDFSKHQQKVIKRFYDNREQIDEQRLSELVTSLYLASDKKKAKLWESVQGILERLKIPDKRVKHIMESADPAILATVVEDLNAGRIQKKK